MIPTEPIGSLPRPPALIAAVERGDSEDPRLDGLYEDAIRDTIERFEATGSPVVTDGEQRKYHNFWTYSVHGLPNTAPDGFRIPFTAGHTRRMPRLTAGPFQAARYIPLDQLGTTDDCGFSPFSDDTSTSRETAFDKIRARVAGTALAADALGVR